MKSIYERYIYIYTEHHIGIIFTTENGDLMWWNDVDSCFYISICKHTHTLIYLIFFIYGRENFNWPFWREFAHQISIHMLIKCRRSVVDSFNGGFVGRGCWGGIPTTFDANIVAEFPAVYVVSQAPNKCRNYIWPFCDFRDTVALEIRTHTLTIWFHSWTIF